MKNNKTFALIDFVNDTYIISECFLLIKIITFIRSYQIHMCSNQEFIILKKATSSFALINLSHKEIKVIKEKIRELEKNICIQKRPFYYHA